MGKSRKNVGQTYWLASTRFLPNSAIRLNQSTSAYSLSMLPFRIDVRYLLDQAHVGLLQNLG